MGYIEYYENFISDSDNVYISEDIDLVMIPSGEIIKLTKKDFDTLSDYLVLDYNKKINAYITDDIRRDVIFMVLNI